MKVFRGLAIAVLAGAVWSGIGTAQEPFTAGQWTALKNAPPTVVGHIQMLTDGSVLALNATCGAVGSWYRLVPDSTGSYENGTWVSGGTLPVGYNPLYFASQVLPNGNLVVIGGEYNGSSTGCQGVETTLGALYNARTNKWVSLAAPAGWSEVGDADSVLLPSGKMMLASCCSKQEAILTLSGTTPTWTTTGTGKFDSNSEEGWTLLPNGKVLTVDAYVGSFSAGGMNSELYTPSTGSWASAGSTVKQLWDSQATCHGSPSYEVGPALQRPDGSVFATGANGCGAGHTAIYKGGKWTAGPDFPGTFDVADGPAALLPDGNVLVMASPGIYKAGSEMFEFDGTNLNATSNPTNAASDSSYYGSMVVLPTGQVLFTDTSQSVEVYTPTGSACAGCGPTVTSVASTLTHGSKNNVIQGTQLNGLSFGAAYGDDSQSATNFPLVRITDSAGHVVYCRTHNWPVAVATGTRIVSAQFDVPGTTALGAGTLEVVTNGIASAGVTVTID